MTVQHQRRPAGPPPSWYRIATPSLVGVLAAAGWIIADITVEVWWAILFGILIGAGIWVATWFYGKSLYYSGKAEVYREQIEDEYLRRWIR